MNITLEQYQESHSDKVKPEHCQLPFERWKEFDDQGSKIVDGMIPFFNKQAQSLDYIFPVFFGVTENLFNNHQLVKYTNNNKNKINSIIIALYDSLMNLYRSYYQKSAMGCSAFARIIFEARVNLQMIALDPENNSKLYSEHKQILTWWYEYKKIDKPSEADKRLMRDKIKNYPVWYDEKWVVMKKKGEKWTGDPADSLMKMSEKVGASLQYRVEYVVNSKFIHISSLLENYYSSTGNSPICNEENLVHTVVPALDSCAEALKAIYDIVGLDGSVIYTALQVPIMIHIDKRFKPKS